MEVYWIFEIFFWAFWKLFWKPFWKPQNWKLFNKIIITKIPALANGDGEVFAELLRLKDVKKQICYENESVYRRFFTNFGKIYEEP